MSLEKFSVIDLFAGAGGLSLGFKLTGQFDIKAAFELNPAMQATYKKNHAGVDVYDDVTKADYQELKKKYGDIDVVIGGPPCQGFSNANRQKSNAINKNNMLVKEYVRAILELQPTAFVMENVSMLKSDVHKFFMNEADKVNIEKYKIETKDDELLLLSREYCTEDVKVLVNSPALVKRYQWSEAFFHEANIIYKLFKNEKKLLLGLSKHEESLTKLAWEYYNQKLSDDTVPKACRSAAMAIIFYYKGLIELNKLKVALTTAINYQQMLRKAQELYDNKIDVKKFSMQKGLVAHIKTFSVLDYIKAVLGSPGNNYNIASGVLNATDYGAPQKRSRYVIMGIKSSVFKKISLPSPNYIAKPLRTVRDAIGDLENLPPFYNLKEDKGLVLGTYDGLSELAQKLRDSKLLMNHITTATTDVAMERFKAIKQGENFHSLDEKMKINTYTNAERTQNTIYLRLNYDEPSGTVVNVRKSMWIHPMLDRAISVREAARLQTFPDSFVFCGTKDQQYQQVGNAVPPLLAKAIANKITRILRKANYKKG